MKTSERPFTPSVVRTLRNARGLIGTPPTRGLGIREHEHIELFDFRHSRTSQDDTKSVLHDLILHAILHVDRATFLLWLVAQPPVVCLLLGNRMATQVKLSEIRREFMAHFDGLADPGGRFGVTDSAKTGDRPLFVRRHRLGPSDHGRRLDGHFVRRRTRRMVGPHQLFRLAGSTAPSPGYIRGRLRHHPLHANGMVVGALGVLGGRQPAPVRLYDEFNSVDRVEAWLERLDWAGQWRASHHFWGCGPHILQSKAARTSGGAPFSTGSIVKSTVADGGVVASVMRIVISRWAKRPHSSTL